MSKAVHITPEVKARIRAAGALVALLLILAVSLASYRSLHELLDAGAAVEHTADVINELTETLSLLKDVQAGERGYIITGDERFLDFYTSAAKETPSSLARLRSLTADNPGQQQRLRDFELLATERLAIAAENIDLRQRLGPGAASNETQWRAKTIMDRARSVVREMTEEENRLYRLRRDDVSVHARTAQYLLLGVVGLGSIAILAAFVLTNREMARRQAAETSLRGMNEELERRVQGRTAELKAKEHFLSTVMDHIEDAIFVDKANRVIFANQACIAFFGTQGVDQIVGRAVRLLSPGLSRDDPWEERVHNFGERH